ncbi:hypothetical protein RDV64_12450 [Acuticoccus sp. MNP-M23]|uniref:AtuA-related protein n=1 Tax=Acuticoccus sp. MNP-M23 TaxID=3072793 RepID=UPI002815EBBD|nr:hypothetical protein [Acuticoccus sp. MNP-M23]WMS40904.1 hypothetical protein RDV64_12450 [Acuticoccus sp. MNP-M23]
MRLHDIAHGRTGDKGEVSNISVIAYRAEDWPLIERDVTPERVARQLALGDNADVSIYRLPQLGALNIVLRGALKGGVTRSLALDPHGKCLAGILLEMELPPHR